MEHTVTLVPKHIFGAKADTHAPVAHLNDHRVLYTAGHNVVIYNRDDRQMQVLSALEGSWGISCLSLCPRKRYLAVAEKAERGIVFVYDTLKKNKKRTLATTDVMASEYIAMAFAHKQEGKFLVTMGGGED